MTEFHCEDGQIAIGPGGGDCGNREAFLLGRKMDLNTATLADLDLIPGFGPKTAEAVIAERERLGGFRSIMALESSGLPGKTKEILIQWTEIK